MFLRIQDHQDPRTDQSANGSPLHRLVTRDQAWRKTTETLHVGFRAAERGPEPGLPVSRRESPRFHQYDVLADEVASSWRRNHTRRSHSLYPRKNWWTRRKTRNRHGNTGTRTRRCTAVNFCSSSLVHVCRLSPDHGHRRLV